MNLREGRNYLLWLVFGVQLSAYPLVNLIPFSSLIVLVSCAITVMATGQNLNCLIL